MKRSPSSASPTRAFTLLELTMVIMVLLALISISFFTSSKINEWKLARQASEVLRSVSAAQRMYLADHPTTNVADLTDAMIIPYIPNLKPKDPQWTTLVDALNTKESAKPIKGDDLRFRITVFPPIFLQGGAPYDPSDSETDSLWDVGEK